jgi:hypothetical protein
MKKDVMVTFRAPADIRDKIDEYLIRNRKRRLHGRKISMGVFILDCIRERFEKYGRAKKCNTKKGPQQTTANSAERPALAASSVSAAEPVRVENGQDQTQVDDATLYTMMD